MWDRVYSRAAGSSSQLTRAIARQSQQKPAPARGDAKDLQDSALDCNRESNDVGRASAAAVDEPLRLKWRESDAVPPRTRG